MNVGDAAPNDDAGAPNFDEDDPNAAVDEENNGAAAAGKGCFYSCRSSP